MKTLKIGHRAGKRVTVPKLAKGRHVLTLYVVPSAENEAVTSDKLVLRVRR